MRHESLQDAAERGDAEAQFNLGTMRRKGEGAPQDNREAAKWYRLAADQGHAGAQYLLGLMHRNGEGLPQDDREAAKRLRQAADQGHAEARLLVREQQPQTWPQPENR